MYFKYGTFLIFRRDRTFYYYYENEYNALEALINKVLKTIRSEYVPHFCFFEILKFLIRLKEYIPIIVPKNFRISRKE